MGSTALFVGFSCWRCDGKFIVVLWWIRAIMLEDNGSIKKFKTVWRRSFVCPSTRNVRSGITKFISFCIPIGFYYNPTIVRIPAPSLGLVSILELVPGFVNYLHLVARPFGSPCCSLRVEKALLRCVLGMLVLALEFFAVLTRVVLPLVDCCWWLGGSVPGFAAASTSS